MLSRSAVGSILTCAVLLLVTACSDSPVAPDELSATDARSMQDRELLLAIMAKLDSIETRLDQESAVLSARLDSMAASGQITVAFARAPGAGGGPPNGGGGNGLPQQMTELRMVTDSIMTLTDVIANEQMATLLPLTDSVMALSDFLAKGAVDPWKGFQVCGGLNVKGNGALKGRTMGDGEGQAGVGVKPWDTGAMAQVELTQRFILELGASAEMQLAVNGCRSLGPAADPPTRPASSSAFTLASGGQLENTLVELQNQLSFDEQRVENALRAGTGVFQTGDFTRLRDLATDLPLPAQYTNPVGIVRTQLQTVKPVELLCDAGLGGPRFADMAVQGCDFIHDNNLPELGTFLDLGENFTTLTDNFDSLCSRFNDVVDRGLTIRKRDVPWEVGIFDTAFEQRLFPSTWGVTCDV